MFDVAGPLVYSLGMRLALLLLLLPITLGGAPALAQDASTDEARGAFAAGQAAYTAGRFAEALGYFERAYELTREPDLLYNIATVHDRLRHDAQALDAYRRYLEARPDADDRANIEARVRVLEGAIERESAAPPPEHVALPEPEPEPEPQREPRPGAQASDAGPGPWIVAIAGGVLLAGGVALLVATQLDLDAVASGTRWSDIEEAYDRVPILSATGWSLLGVGAAALAGGLVWAAVGGGSTEVALGPGGVLVRGTL